MFKKNNTNIYLLLVLLNLSVATSICYGQSINKSGSISIGPCVVDCLIINTPNQLTAEKPIFLSPQGGNLFIATNIALDSKVTIADARNNGGFSLDVNASNFTNNLSNSINYAQIGILTFNNSSQAVDQGFNTPITALNKQNYTYSEITNGLANQNDFMYFSSTNPNNSISDPITGLIYAPPGSNISGQFSFGFGIIIKTPTNPQTNLIDDNYNLNLTFTISGN